MLAAQKKVMVLEMLKEKLRSMAYTLKGASPIELFEKYVTDMRHLFGFVLTCHVAGYAQI